MDERPRALEALFDDADPCPSKTRDADPEARRACAATDYACCAATFEAAGDLGFDALPCSCGCHGFWNYEGPVA